MPSHPLLIPTLALSAAVSAALAPLAAPLIAQPQPTQPAPRHWHSVLEANASLLFGASSQTLTSAALTLSHASSIVTSEGSLRFHYGEAVDAQDVTFVSARGWTAAVSANLLPNGRFSPFLSANSEASLEKRIANRSSGGAGATWVFTKSDAGAGSMTLTLLGERTAAIQTDTISIATETVARVSWRAKFSQKIDEKITFSHETFYNPVLDAPSQYTITSTSSGAYPLNPNVALTLTFTDNYDSQARLRGALRNNDGALLFGVRSAF